MKLADLIRIDRFIEENKSCVPVLDCFGEDHNAKRNFSILYKKLVKPGDAPGRDLDLDEMFLVCEYVLSFKWKYKYSLLSIIAPYHVGPSLTEFGWKIDSLVQKIPGYYAASILKSSGLFNRQNYEKLYSIASSDPWLGEKLFYAMSSLYHNNLLKQQTFDNELSLLMPARHPHQFFTKNDSIKLGNGYLAWENTPNVSKR